MLSFEDSLLFREIQPTCLKVDGNYAEYLKVSFSGCDCEE